MGAEQVRPYSGCPASDWSREVPLALFALKLGALVGLATYVVLGDVSDLDDFISGRLALSGETAKSRDYAAALAFLVSTAVAFVLADEGLRRTAARLPGLITSGFRNGLVLANIPGAIVLGQLLFNIRVDSELLAVSLGAEVTLALCLGVAWWQAGRCPDNSPEASSRSFFWVLLVLLFAYVAGATVPSGWVAALSTQGLYHLGSGDIAAIALVARVIIGVVAAIACVINFTLPEGDQRELRLKLLFLLAQSLLLLALVKLAGSLAIVEGRLEYVAAATPTATLILLVLGLLSICHLWVMGRALRRASPAVSPRFIATPVAVALLAALLKTAPDLPADFNLLDDYHTGEYVLPYWALTKWGLIPYDDLDLARGWINLFPGLIAEEGLGGTYASYVYTNTQRVFLISLLLFVATRPLVGTWGALILVILAPIGLLSEIDIVLTAIFALLVWAYFSWTPSGWMLLWIFLGTLGVLIAPGQGGLLVLAMGPLGVARMLAALRIELGQFAITALALMVMVAFALFSPIPDTVLGAVRYAIEQAAVNTEAHGIPWALGFARWEQGKGVLFELARSSWLLVTVGIFFYSWIALRSNRSLEEKRRILVVAVPIVLLGLLFVLRAWGRIDPGGWSRPAVTSSWFVTLLLPVFVFTVSRRQLSSLVVLALAAAAAILPAPRWSFSGANALQSVSASDLIDGANYGVPALGRYPYKSEQVKNYAALKRFADTELAPGAPLLDLTNRNSLQYLLDRPPALPAAVYNLANPVQQSRVVHMLTTKPPLLALADSNSIRHDGGVLGLRANTLFRFVVENYQPVEDSGAIWMRYAPGGAMDRDETYFALLDRAFMQSNLGSIPSAWGLSWNVLADKTRGEVRLENTNEILHDMVRVPDGGFVVTGLDPYVLMTVPPGIDSSRWGLLIFDFACSAGREATLEVFWANQFVPELTPKASLRFVARPGRVIVPLDFAPRWIRGGDVSHVRIDLVDSVICPGWAVSDVFLTSRATDADSTL